MVAFSDTGKFSKEIARFARAQTERDNERHTLNGLSLPVGTRREGRIMDSNEIDTYLHALDEELAKRLIRKPVHIVVVGGVYMLFFLRNRAATNDVDIVPLDFPDSTNPTQETKVFRSAINAIAKTYRLRRDRMN